MRKLFTITLLFVSYFSFGQLENANWCMPYLARVDFNTAIPTAGVSANDNSIFTNQYGITCASVSNSSGQLLFYSDGVRVWDKTHNIMQNGSNIGGGSGTGWAEQGAVIVPKPGSETIYYIFTACKFTESTPPNLNHAGFHYSIIDISLNGGNGAVVMSKVPLKDELGRLMDYDFGTSTGLQIQESSMTSALNNTQDKIWLTIFTRFHESGVVKRMAYTYLVGSDGINHFADGVSPTPNTATPLIIRCPMANSLCSDFGGSIKISPNGMYLGNEAKDIVDLYRFNNTTGAIDYDHIVFNGAPVMAMPGYGLEFSPNSQLIYFSTYDCGLCQDVSKSSLGGGGETNTNMIRVRQASVTSASKNGNVIVGEFAVPAFSNGRIPLPGTTYGELQLAPNGKIYACAYYSGVFPPGANLGAVNYPDVPGINCQYVNNAITLYPGTEQFGSLPQWVHKTKPAEWPKSYSFARGARQLTMNPLNNNFLVQYYTGCTCFDFQHNHAGVAIPTIGQSGNIRIHYNGNTAYSNYFTTNTISALSLPNMFCNNNGELLTRNGTTNTEVFDFTTGQPLSSLPFSDEILAQASSNKYLTISTGNTLKLTDAAGIVYSSVQLSSSIAIAKYDKANDILYCYDHGNHYSAFKVYSTSITTLYQQNLPAPTPPSGYIYNVASITDNGIMYYLHNLTLMKYDPAMTTFSSVSLPGFNNTGLHRCTSSNPYTDNKVLLINGSDNYLYLIDHLTGNVKKINYQGRDDAFIADYSFDNGQQNIFLTGVTRDVPMTIGTQVIPAAPNVSHSVFVTKLNIQSDFQRQTVIEYSQYSRVAAQEISNNIIETNEASISVSPNPVTDILTVSLRKNNNGSSGPLLIIIKDIKGNTVLSRKVLQPGTISIAVPAFKKGIYYLECIDKNDKLTSSFIKL